MKLLRWDCCRLIAQSLAGLSVIAGLIAFPSSNAFANPTPPPSDNSYYIFTTTTVANANSWGCSQAQADASTGHNSLVVFDFGAQTSDGQYTVQQGEPVTDSSYWMSVSWDEQLAEQFALGYQQCGTHQENTSLAMGINNSAGTTIYSTGVAWGQAVEAAINNIVSANYYNATIYGAGDWESWGSYTDLANWEPGYVSATGVFLADFGSADGCTSSYNSETTNQLILLCWLVSG